MAERRGNFHWICQKRLCTSQYLLVPGAEGAASFVKVLTCHTADRLAGRRHPGILASWQQAAGILASRQQPRSQLVCCRLRASISPTVVACRRRDVCTVYTEHILVVVLGIVLLLPHPTPTQLRLQLSWGQDEPCH